MTSHTTLADTHHVTASAVAGELIDDRYQLVTLLDASGQGETWKARDVRLNRDVAVELTYSRTRADAVAGSLQQIVSGRHSHVAQIYDAGSHTLPAGSCTFVVTPSATPVVDHSTGFVSRLRRALRISVANLATEAP